MKKSDFRKLQKKWYKKLKDEGFKDIEHNGEASLVHNFNKNTQHPALWWEAKAEYYRLACQFLHEYKFQSTLDHIIWEYHSEGISSEYIAKILKKVKVKKMSNSNVKAVIKRLKIKMFDMFMVPHKEYHE